MNWQEKTYAAAERAGLVRIGMRVVEGKIKSDDGAVDTRPFLWFGRIRRL